MKLYRAIMAKYDPKANANDGLNLYGVSKAWTTVQLLQLAGQEPHAGGPDEGGAQPRTSPPRRRREPVPLPGRDRVDEGRRPVPDLAGDAGQVPEQRLPAVRQADQRPRRSSADPTLLTRGPALAGPSRLRQDARMPEAVIVSTRARRSAVPPRARSSTRGPTTSPRSRSTPRSRRCPSSPRRRSST